MNTVAAERSAGHRKSKLHKTSASAGVLYVLQTMQQQPELTGATAPILQGEKRESERKITQLCGKDAARTSFLLTQASLSFPKRHAGTDAMLEERHTSLERRKLRSGWWRFDGDVHLA